MKYILALLTLCGFVLSAQAKSLPGLEGKYIYLAPDSDFKISRFEIEIKDGKISFPGDAPQIKNIEISEGAQADFLATLKNNIPGGVKFYKIDADLSGGGEPVKATLLLQSINDENPRLAVYAVAEGRPVALMRGFAVSEPAQMKALEAEEKRLR